MRRIAWLLVAAAILPMVAAARGRHQIPPPVDWRESTQKVHVRFHGSPGTLMLIGDSITVTQAFWQPLQYDVHGGSPEFMVALKRVKAWMKPQCWGWKGPEYGSEGGKTVAWANEHIDEWLKKLNPEVAVILLGTNDLASVEPDDYNAALGTLIRKIQADGTVVILTTVPPRDGQAFRSAMYAARDRQLAAELGLPLIDFRQEIQKRRPDDWNGAIEKFAAYEGYEVPTLISRDGVHPSYPRKYQNDYSEEALNNCGYGLRTYLTLLKLDEVIGALSGTQQAASLPKSAGSAPAIPPSRREWAVGTLLAASQGGVPSAPFWPVAKPLPAPAGEVVPVANVEQLLAAAERVPEGGTILLADGIYRLPKRLDINENRVSLRSASGNRDKVVLDGGGLGEAVALTGSDGVTVADLTIQNVRWNGLKINSETGVNRALIHNVVFHNIWQRMIKGVIVPPADRDRIHPSGFVVENCLFYNDRPKRYEDDPADTEQNFKGNYIGGIDVMFARDWTIRDNVFTGIHGRTGECRGAVFLWQDIRNCVVERNIVVDCDSGICLGNSSKPADIAVHATGCIVRNNWVTRCHENGILADYTQDCRIERNRIHDPESRLGRLIRLVHDNPGLVVADNMVSGPPIRNESPSRITFAHNEERDLTSRFADPGRGDLTVKKAE